MDIEAFIKIMKKVPGKKFNETISKGALHMTDKQINTVSFVFWFCYMAETDLESILIEAWQKSSQSFSTKVNKQAKKTLKEMVFGKKDLELNNFLKKISPEIATKITSTIKQNYIPKRDFDIENLEYFSDKIKILEAIVGENEQTKILWKINTIRNDISHNRISTLKYNSKNLSLRKTREKLLVDYLRIFQT